MVSKPIAIGVDREKIPFFRQDKSLGIAMCFFFFSFLFYSQYCSNSVINSLEIVPTGEPIGFVSFRLAATPL